MKKKPIIIMSLIILVITIFFVLKKNIYKPETKINNNGEAINVVSPLPNGSNKIIYTGNYDEINTYFEKEGWTDGYPINPPTDEKIKDYLRYTSYDSNDIIIKNVTTYNVSANAIMAGVPKELMPLCIAIVKGYGNLDWLNKDLDNHVVIPVAIISGPLGRQLNIDNSQGMISAENNKILSRFITLSIKNIVGYEIGKNSSFGTAEPIVFAENEESATNVKWQPYHVQKGYNVNDSVITLTTITSWGNNLTPATPTAEKTMEVIADDITEKDSFGLGSGNSDSYKTILMSESIAKKLSEKYKTKEELQNALVDTALRPLGLKAYATYYTNPKEDISKKYTYTQNYENLKKELDIKTDIIPNWYKPLLYGETKLDTYKVLKNNKVRIIIAGDSTRNKTQVMSGGSENNIKVELPNDWDNLIGELNFRPYYNFEKLCTYYLDKKCDGEKTVVTKSNNVITSNEQYSVLTPMAYSKVEMVKQAKRLDTLEGKRIAIVGRSFNAVVTQKVLKELILKDYPTAKIFTVDDIGVGGIYSVTNQSKQSRDFQQKLKDMKIDAVISGNCGCGLCTVKESGSSIAAEYIGIPSVTVGATSFINEIHSTGTNRGIPVLRTVEYPGAFSADSIEELEKKTREIIYPKVVTALTTQITKEEINEFAKEGYRNYDDIIVTGTYDMIQEYYRMNDLSDGLPVVIPTKEKVEEYLKYTPYEKDKVLGSIPVAYRDANVYNVAVNAIMAGLPPEYMPICIAFVENMTNGEWRRPLASTHAWTPYAWINGPLARQLNISNEQGMMNTSQNKKFGRFIEFAMLNLGGYYIKENRMGTFGYLTPWFFSENEEYDKQIGWEPYHVQKGYNLNSNTLTSASAMFYGNDLTVSTTDVDKISDVIAFDVTEVQQNALGNTNPQVYRTMLLTPTLAKQLSNKYNTKIEFEIALITKARRPLWLRTYANYWANTGSYQFNSKTFKEYYNSLLNSEKEDAKESSIPSWYNNIITSQKLITIKTMNKSQTAFLVAGSNSKNNVEILPGGDFVTTEIKLPDNWDELMMKKGYKSLKEYELK